MEAEQEIIEIDDIDAIVTNEEADTKKAAFKSWDNNETNEYWDLIYLRNSRNSSLQLTDKYLMPDYPITPENIEIIKSYRHELRNCINKNEHFILSGVIPEIPPIPL